MQQRARLQAGFSFIEMVVVIVVMGIMATGLVTFITNSASSYVTTASRNQVSSAGRVVIDRIAMELHNALPLSVRTTTPLSAGDESAGYGYENDQCIEFIPVMAATTYLNARFRPTAASGDPFNVINLVPSQVGETDRYAVIYPTREEDLYQDSFGATEVIVELAAITDSNNTDGIHELDPAIAHRFQRRSPQERLFITTQPVSFCVSGNRLYRYSDYGFFADQRVPYGPTGSCEAGPTSCLPDATPERELLTDMIDNSVLSNASFDFLATTRRRNGVIQIELNFSQDGESVRLNHEVLQQASP